MSSFRSIIKTIGLVCLALLVLGGIGEGYLRLNHSDVADHYIDDAELYWTPRPGTPRSEEDPDVIETVGDDGMRVSRPAITYTKKHTVLVSGCSYTFGIGVSDDETYVWRLNELCPSADFDNCGASGYGAYRNLIRQERYLLREPYDLVIYAMQANHLERDTMAHQAFTGRDNKADLVALPYVEMRGPNDFVEHPAEMYYWPGDTRSCLINFLRNFALSLKVRTRPVPNAEQKQAIFAYLINKMAAQAQEEGAKFVLAVLTSNPVPVELYAPEVTIIDIHHPEGEDFTDEHRVRHQHKNHPNGIIHDFWARELLKKLQDTHLLD